MAVVQKEKRKLFLVVVHNSEKLTLMPKPKRRALIYYNLLSIFVVALTTPKHANVFTCPLRSRVECLYI